MRIRMLLFSIALSFVMSGFLFNALAQESPPQQSTTGPVPPPSVLEKSAMRMAPPAEGRASKTLPVPGYEWRHGCGPTAVGMVIGYYDGLGFDDLIPGDASTQTADVNQCIASQGSGVRGVGVQKHYEDYALPMDSSEPSVLADSSETYPVGCHTDDSIADYMHTSWSSDGNFYGWSWSNMISTAFGSFVDQQNYDYWYSTDDLMISNGTLSWSVLTQEIDNNRPMVFLVDTDGDGYTDHFVTVVGYSDGPPQQYGCLDTWYPYGDVRWCNFSGIGSGVPWGIWGGWSFRMYCLLQVQAVNGEVASDPDQSMFDPGASVTLTATPDEGYTFVSWTGDVPSGHETDNPLALTMDGNRSLTAVFALGQYTVTYQTDGTPGATLSGDTSQTVTYGDAFTPVTANAPAGYIFKYWVRTDGAPYFFFSANPLTLTNVAYDMTLTATFVLDFSCGAENWGRYR
ncbi:hypothetical protein JXA32_01930 [Candidatus Sumerlaeota bacterium]|nr:hypothetical protein [Candidatus Sumerlaeota bacterium]